MGVASKGARTTIKPGFVKFAHKTLANHGSRLTVQQWREAMDVDVVRTHQVRRILIQQGIVELDPARATVKLLQDYDENGYGF